MSPSISESIKTCRILCIFLMTYVHVNPGPSNWGEDVSQALHWTGIIMSDLLGRASVPALSLIGGFLAVSSFRKKTSWIKYSSGRFSTLIIPAITWNLIIVLLSLLILILTKSETFVIREIKEIDSLTIWIALDKLTGYNYGSITLAFNFLRDIFICSLTIPLLIHLNTKYGFLTILTIWSIGLTIGFEPLIFRPHILMFFSLGIYIFIKKEQEVSLKQISINSALAVLISLSASHIYSTILNQGSNIESTALRIIMTIIILIISFYTTKTKLKPYIEKIEPIAFLLFLSHQSTMLFLWGGWQIKFGNSTNGPYILFYIFTPILTAAITLIVYRIISKAPEKLQLILIGK